MEWREKMQQHFKKQKKFDSVCRKRRLNAIHDEENASKNDIKAPKNETNAKFFKR